MKIMNLSPEDREMNFSTKLTALYVVGLDVVKRGDVYDLVYRYIPQR